MLIIPAIRCESSGDGQFRQNAKLTDVRQTTYSLVHYIHVRMSQYTVVILLCTVVRIKKALRLRSVSYLSKVRTVTVSLYKGVGSAGYHNYYSSKKVVYDNISRIASHHADDHVILLILLIIASKASDSLLSLVIVSSPKHILRSSCDDGS
jgi:hypothetical protein